MDDVEFIFKIHAYSPETFPMERLGRYMADLGTLLGDQDHVHFKGLANGSTCLHHSIRHEAVARVERRISGINDGNAPANVVKAFAELNKRLADDNAAAEYRRANSPAIVLRFPGVEARQPEIIGPIERASTLDGVVIALGGRDESVPVRVQAPDALHECNATRDLARSIAPFIFGQTLRFTGVGKWYRHEDSGWSMKHFRIDSFDPLDERSIDQIVAEMRGMDVNWASAHIDAEEDEG